MNISFVFQLKDSGYLIIFSLRFSIKYLIYNNKYSKLHLI